MQKLSNKKINLLAVILLVGSLSWMTAEADSSSDFAGEAITSICRHSNNLGLINGISKLILYTGMTLTVCTALPIIATLGLCLGVGTIGLDVDAVERSHHYKFWF